ncbi:protealysin inhibitor emfourin [Microbacterium sp. KR10-403]|uniref:protealysin inhibitor emfourin n=1 Tax=Microbacterium sp. KR10-403 TaxID=3158581 RepID=UPI0032E3D537
METTDDPVLSITVVRTGGFAGLRREWSVQPPEPAREHWIMLIRQCPWNDVDAAAPPGPDRFTWHIQAQLGTDDRRADVPETQLHGPWRDLVAEVQSFEQEREGNGPGAADDPGR